MIEGEIIIHEKLININVQYDVTTTSKPTIYNHN